MSRHPSTKWAQRPDKLFITIELPDAKNVKLTLQPDGRFYFYASSGPDNTPYEVDLELYDKVNVEESKAAVGLRNICYLVKKAENKWWSRLLKKEGKPPVFLKVDWDKWIDEDEEREKPIGEDMGSFGDNMDFSKLGMSDDDDFDMDADNNGVNGVDTKAEGNVKAEEAASTSAGLVPEEEAEAKV